MFICTSSPALVGPSGPSRSLYGEFQMTTVHRVYQLLGRARGPAGLGARADSARLVALPGVGMSVLEISHRSKTFEDILAQAEADIRELAGIPANYKVLFLQGGASLQFSMVPMNLLGAGPDGRLHRYRHRGPTRRSRKPRRSAP